MLIDRCGSKITGYLGQKIAPLQVSTYLLNIDVAYGCYMLFLAVKVTVVLWDILSVTVVKFFRSDCTRDCRRSIFQHSGAQVSVHAETVTGDNLIILSVLFFVLEQTRLLL